MGSHPQRCGTEIGKIDPVRRTEQLNLRKARKGLPRIVHRQVDHAERLECAGIVGIVPQQGLAERLGATEITRTAMAFGLRQPGKCLLNLRHCRLSCERRHGLGLGALTLGRYSLVIGNLELEHRAAILS